MRPRGRAPTANGTTTGPLEIHLSSLSPWRFSRWAAVVAVGAIAFVPIAEAQLPSPLQAGFYQPGVANLRDYATPSPGFYIIDYNIWTKSDGFYDRNGNRVGEVDLSQIDPSLGTVNLDLDANAYVNAFVVAWVSKRLKPFGDASYVAALVPTFVSANYGVSVYPADGTDGARAEGGAGGFGDMGFIPLGLSWSFDQKFDLSFYYTVYAPTGRYEAGADDNTGVGYWGHTFQVPFYAYFFDQAMALGVIPTLEVNNRIRGTNVRPGSRLTLEYGISQYFTEWLELMIVNAHSFQVEDDKGSDIWWRGTPLDGKDRKNTFVAGVGAWPWKERLYLSFKYARDYGVRRRFLNNTFSLTLVFVTGLLGDPR